MDYNYLKDQISQDLFELCVTIGERHPGSERNRKATDYVCRRFNKSGFTVTMTPFDCLDWEYGDITLKVGNDQIPAFIGPYNESCQISGRFKTASTIDELTEVEVSHQILVLHGDLCKEQLAAKNFTFYNPERDQQIIALLEQKKPQAIITITGSNPDLTGALCPFPLIEDGDFLIPTAYVSEAVGARMLAQPAGEIYLNMESWRIPAQAHNVIAVKPGQNPERIVFCAHIDTKKGTPGAVDNAGGVCLLLSLADLLSDYQGKYTIELIALNGEDHYAYPGGVSYLEENRDRLGEIRVVVNSDGAGSKGSRTTYCHFNASDALVQAVSAVFHDQNKFTPVEPWYQSDHAAFAVNGVPAVALTNEAFKEVWSSIAHTEKDTVEQVDPYILSGIVGSLYEFIQELNRTI